MQTSQVVCKLQGPWETEGVWHTVQLHPETILGVYLAVGAEVVFFAFAVGDCIGFAGYAEFDYWVELERFIMTLGGCREVLWI